MSGSALSAMGLLWRLMRCPPSGLAMLCWQTRLAHGTRYPLFFAALLVGCAHICAAGFPLRLLRAIQLFDLIFANKELDAALLP